MKNNKFFVAQRCADQYLKLSFLTLLALSASNALAQLDRTSESTASTPSIAPKSEDAKSLNGFAQELRPKIKRKGARSDAAYAPVKHIDDLGQTPEIEMFVGESRVLPAPGVGRIAVGNGRIMTAAVLDKREILLFANDQGTSSLFIWNEDGRYQRLKINIVPGDTSRIGREIAAFLSGIAGAKASIVGDKVIIEGDQLSDADLAKINKLEKTYPQIVNFTSPQGWEKMVMIDVKVVEFPKTELQELGLKWTPTGGGAIGAVWAPIRQGKNGPYQINIPSGTGQTSLPITDAGLTTTTMHSALNAIGAINMGLAAQLNAMAQDGKASILAEPQMSTRSGFPAKFIAGGEYPYVVSTINGPTVQFKPYGVRLDIKPTVDKNGYIRANIFTEVSSIDATVSTPQGPALKTRSTDTEFNVKGGDTIVLSGMLLRDNSTSIDKVPFLGDIPILGALFRSKRFQNNQTELVVFVTPTVVDAHTPALVDRIEKTKERLEQQLGNIPYLTDPLQPGRDAGILGDVVATKEAGILSSRRALPPPAEQVAIDRPVLRDAANATTFVRGDKNPLADGRAQGEGGGSNLRVMLDGLALRASPNVNSAILLQLGKGSVVQLGGQETPAALASLWRNVSVGNVNGWVASKWVVPSVKETSAINVQNGVTARQAQSGKSVQGVVAQARPAALSAVGKSALEQAPVVVHRYRVILPRLAMRVAPDVNAAVVQQVAEGTIVTAMTDSAQAGWLSIEVGGQRGWVAAQWLEPQL